MTSRLAACIAAALLGLAGCPPSESERGEQAHLEAARAQLSQRRSDAAREELARALELAPDSAEGHRLLGEALEAQGLDERALAAYRRTTELDPEDAEAWRRWGNLLASGGENTQALEKLERAVRLDGSNRPARVDRAVALALLGRHSEATRGFEELTRRDPRLPADALTAWGSALAALGRRAEARERFERALIEDHEHVGALTRLATELRKSGDRRERGRAVELFETVLRLRPGDAAALHNLGLAYLDSGRLHGAREQLERSVAATPADDPLRAARLESLERARAALLRAPAAPGGPDR